jgi:hypothetical protein
VLVVDGSLITRNANRVARKNHNPGCPCCEVGFPCDPTDCGDETTSPIRRVTLELVMPDEIVAISQGSGGTGARNAHISSGWTSLNGTYNFLLNLSTCKWDSIKVLDSSDVYAEAWRLPSIANCSNYLDLIDPSRDIPILAPQLLTGEQVNLEMVTTSFQAVFKHEFTITIPANGPFFQWRIKADDLLGELCVESPLVFDRVRLFDGASTTDAEFVCAGDDAGASKAVSHVS